MQSLWSRAALSQTSCRCVSCLSTTANGVASRSAGAASKKRLRIGNSVTALYTSIFAAAALADARAKSQRRNDWEEKIAAVKAEVDVLVDEEQRMIESLQRRRKTRGVNRLLRTRGFGAASNFVPASEQRVTFSPPTRSFHTAHPLSNATTTKTNAADTVNTEEHEEIEEKWLDEENTYNLEEEHLDMEQSEAFPSWMDKEPLRVKAIQKLALKQFAIRLLLRPAIAHRYSGVKMNYEADLEIPKINVDRLLGELNAIRNRISHLRTNREANFDDLVQGLSKRGSYNKKASRLRDQLDLELQDDIQLYERKQMSLQELLLRISGNIMESVEPDRTDAFRAMIGAFARTRQNDLNELLLRTIIPNFFYFSTSLIITIFAFYRKTKNLRDFDQFLRMLSGRGWPINIGNLGTWRIMTMNGLELVVPPLDSNNPILYVELIVASLRFDQPDRADAFLQAARKAGFFDSFVTLAAYLRFCSIRQDWNKGLTVLRRAITYLVASTSPAETHVPRILTRMVQLCDSCNRQDVSQVLIDAAVHSGFDPSIPLNQHDIFPIVDRAGERWKRAAETTPIENINRPLWQKCYDFAIIFGEHLKKLEESDSGISSHQYERLSAQYSHHAMNASLAGISTQTTTGRATSKSAPSPPPESDPSQEEAQLHNTQAEELSAMKIEMAQLRQLVFQLREHHIESSFKDERLYDEVSLDKPSVRRWKAYEYSPIDYDDPHMSIKFERKSTPVEETDEPPIQPLSNPRVQDQHTVSVSNSKQTAAGNSGPRSAHGPLTATSGTG
ncbi:hypothetical protein N7532_005422 [Penicillium argentinense]|uniref:Uncharacterized protein n=1 Tax=Penicillium argentinense TaxID=1131581 RepID=A0A9W9FDV6_9EURO|nr:uncharacterized protein N7532_005422 [Penicillium argentinense]KAJ5098421.1 hypothetical protein N7532_005422 [Penicillium argentinense]